MSEEKKESAPKQNSGDSTAAKYIDQQLVKSRKGLQITRIVMIVLAVFMFIYLTVLKVKLSEYYEPKGAAETALGMVSDQFDTYTKQALVEMDTQIPKFLAPIPDKIIASLPEYREKLRAKIVASMREYAQKTSKDLGETLDGVLAAHGEQIAILLKTADDPDSANALAHVITDEITSVLDKKGPNGESIHDKLSLSLTTLKNIESHIARLATTDSTLTENEKKQRRVIAILMRTVEQDLEGTVLEVDKKN
jgi:hypothetical protein